MKLVVQDKDKGYLKCTYNKKDTHTLRVNLDNLLDFYPLNLAYDLKINGRGTELSLCRLTSRLPSQYNDTGEGYVVNKVRIDDGLYFSDIKRENDKLMEKARDYDLKIYTDEYTLDDVELNFAKIRVVFEDINNKLIQEYLENKVVNKELFIEKNISTQLDIALRHSSYDLQEAYNELGQLYNMTVLMKKRLVGKKDLILSNLVQNLAFNFE